MAVDNASQIDAIANDKENACLVLLITDHLNWDNEFEHLKILQDKINAYVAFIESEQYDEIYPVKAKLFCPEIAGLFCRIAGLFCHDSRANLSLKPVCFGIAIS